MIEADTQNIYCDSNISNIENQNEVNNNELNNIENQSADNDKQNVYENKYINYLKENRKRVIVFCELIAIVFICIFIFYKKNKSDCIGEVCKENVTVLANATRYVVEDILPMALKNELPEFMDNGGVSDIVEEKTGDLIKAINVQLKYNARIEEESEDSATIVLSVSNASLSEGIIHFISSDLLDGVQEYGLTDFFEDAVAVYDDGIKETVSNCIDSVIEKIREERQNAETVNNEIRFRFQRENDKIKYIYDKEEWRKLLVAIYGVDAFEDYFTDFMDSEDFDNGTDFEFEFGINQVFDEEIILQEMKEAIQKEDLEDDEDSEGDGYQVDE